MVHISQNRPVLPRVERSADSRRSSQKPAPVNTGQLSSANLLKHSFDTMRGRRSTINPESREADFFESAQWLCTQFGFDPTAVVGGYPLNVASEITRLRKLLADQHEVMYTQLMVVETTDRAASLHLTTALDSGTLWYIAIKPFLALKATNRPLFQLMQSCFSYLLRCGMPYYTDESSYVSYQYDGAIDRLEEEIFQACEGDDVKSYREQIRAIKTAQKKGKPVFERLHSRTHLREWESRLLATTATNDREADLLEVGRQLLAVYRKYGSRRIDAGINPCEQDDEENGDEWIHMDHYVSFIWDNDSFTSQLIDDLNNCEYANAGGTDQPTGAICFDKPGAAFDYDLSFEIALFTQINALTYLF